MEENKLVYLSAADVKACGVKIKQVITALEAMFLEKGQGHVEMPPKPGIHTRPDAFIHAMPAYIPTMHSAGMKWVSGYPENYKRELPYIAGLLILNDEETGLPYCVMDCTWITAIRTAAATAVAAKVFAREDSQTIGILACGVQGRNNLEALACCFKVKTVHAFDLIYDKAKCYALEMSHILGLNIIAVDSPEKAVRDMDIIVTSGPILKHPTPVIEDSWLTPGAFACPLDFDSSWKSEVFINADVFVTDDLAQLCYYQSLGYFSHIPPIDTILDLGDVIAAKTPRRENDNQRIISLNLGIALADMATAPLVYNKAKEKGLGTLLDL